MFKSIIEDENGIEGSNRKFTQKKFVFGTKIKWNVGEDVEM